MAVAKPKSPLSLLGFIIWGLAALFFLYEFFLRTVVGSVAHQVIPDLKLNPETFALIGSAYYLTYAVMQIPVGILTDKFGVKYIMIFAVLVATGATFWFAHATGFGSALSSRLFMGFGSAFAFVCLLVIAMTWFPRRYFGFFAGISQFIGTMGPILAGGPLIILMTRLHESWRTALIQIGSFGIILAILMLIFVKNKPRGGEQALILLKKEQALSHRLVKLSKNTQAWCIALYSATVYIAMPLLGAIWGTDYLQARGLSQAVAADIISLAWLGYAVGCPLLGALSDIARRRKPTLVFCAVLGLFSTAAVVYLPLQQSKWSYSFLFFCIGMAASGQNVGFATISEQVEMATRATALGLNNGAIILFGALIPPLASYFIYLSAGGQSEQLAAGNFMVGFTLMPILYAVSLLLSLLLIKETYCRPQKETIMLNT